MLRAELTEVDGQKVWGVTDGYKWYFYAYKERHAAEIMAVRLDETAMVRAGNICHHKAFKVSEATADEIRENLNY